MDGHLLPMLSCLRNSKHCQLQQIPSIQPMLLFMLLMRDIMPNAHVEVTLVYSCIYFNFHTATFQMRLQQKCLQVTKVLQYEFPIT